MRVPCGAGDSVGGALGPAREKRRGPDGPRRAPHPKAASSAAADWRPMPAADSGSRS